MTENELLKALEGLLDRLSSVERRLSAAEAQNRSMTNNAAVNGRLATLEGIVRQTLEQQAQHILGDAAKGMALNTLQRVIEKNGGSKYDLMNMQLPD